MRINKFLKFISFLAVTVSFIGVACSKRDPIPNSHHGRTPKYLLAGSLDSSANDANFDFYSIDDGAAYAVALKSDRVTSSTAITIPNEKDGTPVTGIWRSGFANCHAASIAIPNTITVIDYEAFMGSYINVATIPASVNEIGEGAFYYCKNLTKVTIQNSTSSSDASSACSCSEIIDDDDNQQQRTYSELKVIPSFCFHNCFNLRELMLPESIEEIEYEAFNGCKSLFSTLAFMNIKAIRSRAFQGCSSLKTVYISNTFFERNDNDKIIGIIEDKAFENCNTDLKFYLVGDSDDVTEWIGTAGNENWNRKSEYVAPGSQINPEETASNRYTYYISEAGASYSNDWIYTVSFNNVTQENDVTIQSYIGPTEIDGHAVKFLSFPNELPSGSGHYVRAIDTAFLNSSSVKASVERLYLPTTLRRIDNSQFGTGFNNLIVVDSNTKCAGDETYLSENPTESLRPRIILNELTNLEVIGNKAFTDMPNIASVEKLYLPSSLIVVGINAFGTGGTANKQMKSVKDFRWYYDDENSALKAIGRSAFYNLGVSDANKKNYDDTPVHQGYLDSAGNKNYELTTLVFPRTFEHFGITATDMTNYGLDAYEPNNGDFGITAFAGCPLISTVVFRGSDDASKTNNLAIPSYTFVMNESLRTIIFEERKNKTIVFHTGGNANRPAIGWSSGKKNNDFGGDPALQTLVLPNKDTKLYMQDFAFQGNSRGVIYLSGSENSKMYGYNTDKLPNNNSVTSISFPSSNTSITNSQYKSWRTIGDEEYCSKNTTYPGYCLASDLNDYPNSTRNTYNLNQKMPVYWNVHYQKTITVNDVSIDVEVGSDNSNEYVEQNNCSFVTDTASGKATMTNYLYDRYTPTPTFNGTAIVPATVTDSHNNSFTVNVIGASAFSAAYCDDTSYKNDSLHKDLTAVLLPDSIETIGEYAFMRAYGVKNLYSYSSNPNSPHNDYVVPSSLSFIDKHAFAFCNIEQFLNIPDNCQFYENRDAGANEIVTSVFSNDYSLRKITFGSNGDTSSSKYTTTTYAHSASETYTSAIYSQAGLTRNSNSLLLVLNRDSSDYLKRSQDLISVDVLVNEQTKQYSQFDGQYVSGGKFLYGAFKMCYWLDSLIVGETGNLSGTNPIEQPLISGIYEDTLFYLNKAYDFTGYTCALKTISFNNLSIDMTSPYSFEGCEQLHTIRLPQNEGGKIPAGLFAFMSNANVQFEVPADAECTSYKTCEKGVLDLRYTGYASIEAEAFKGTGIKTLIAPESTENVTTFTIEKNAFGNCDSLDLIDFQYVTGTVFLNGSFCGSKIKEDLFNFGSSAYIEFGDETFRGCDFTDKEFNFPVKTRLIGSYCFADCPTLETVGADGNLTNLKRVASDNVPGKNNDGSDGRATTFKQIGDFAFVKCTNLKNFDFSKFVDLERIGHYAFAMVASTGGNIVTANQGEKNNNNATICPDGDVVLPSSLTNLGVGAFHSSKIVNVTIDSTSMKFERGNAYTTVERVGENKGGHQFRWCTALKIVYFSHSDCDFSNVAYLTANANNNHNSPYYGNPGQGQDNYFSNCGSLEKVFMPSTYDIQYFANPPTNKDDRTIRPDSMVYQSNASVKIYLYHSIKDCDLSKPFCVYWHRTSGENYNNLYFRVNDISDVVNVNNNYTQWVESLKFWGTLDDGTTIVELGTVVSVNATDGVVQFNGYYVDSTGIHSGTYVSNP